MSVTVALQQIAIDGMLVGFVVDGMLAIAVVGMLAIAEERNVAPGTPTPALEALTPQTVVLGAFGGFPQEYLARQFQSVKLGTQEIADHGVGQPVQDLTVFAGMHETAEAGIRGAVISGQQKLVIDGLSSPSTAKPATLNGLEFFNRLTPRLALLPDF